MSRSSRYSPVIVWSPTMFEPVINVLPLLKYSA
ncbi:MAG: hypothetical protein H6Q02_1967, partial [Acidobacteria bacterium]|nr:hypothetical protein [Acidobacteriota bacterium]